LLRHIPAGDDLARLGVASLNLQWNGDVMDTMLEIVRDNRWKGSRAGNNQEASNAKTICVLSIGLEVPDHVSNDALRGEPNLRYYGVRDCRDLSMIPEQIVIELAVLHCTLSPFELERASATIRRRWAHARILVIRLDEDFLDDALYDQRIVPPVAQAELRATIKLLLSRRHDPSFSANEQQGSK
jgi:hypothetical protein